VNEGGGIYAYLGTAPAQRSGFASFLLGSVTSVPAVTAQPPNTSYTFSLELVFATVQ